MDDTELMKQARECRQTMNDPDAPPRDRARWAAWVSAAPEHRDAYFAAAHEMDQGEQRPRWDRRLYFALILAIGVLAAWILVLLV